MKTGQRYGKDLALPKFTFKEFVFAPHPRQADIDKFRALPSLVTGGIPCQITTYIHLAAPTSP